MAILSTLRAYAAQLGHSLIHPDSVRTNRDTDLIKLLACICMLIDHAGKMLFPHIPQMRLIGRLAFPMFAYCIAVGAVYTRDPIKYLSRLMLLALISQPLYALGLDHANSEMFAVSLFDDPLGAARSFYIYSWEKPSILLSLVLGLSIVTAIRRRQWLAALFVYIVCCRFSSSLDYGIGGIRLIILFYALCEHPIAALAILCTYMVSWSAGIGYTLFDHSFGMRIFALPAVIFCCLPLARRIRLPRWLLYGFYPAHLAILAILCRI